ncbi:MAG: ABC transporter permease [Candidatus Dormibacteria bacterium]
MDVLGQVFGSRRLRPALSPPPAVSAFRRHVSLTLELAVTQFRLRYTGSVLGYAWSLLRPFFLFGINYIVFIYVLKVGGKEFGTQLLVGIVAWTFFAEGTGAALTSIASNGHLLRKAAFPRVVLVVASMLTALFTFLINLSLVVVVTTALGHMHLSVRSLWAVPLLAELALLATGIGLLLSALFVFYRDVGHLWEIFSQLLFYASAIVFPFSFLLRGRVLPHIVGANPVAQVIEDLRRALVIDDPTVPWTASVDGILFVIPLALVGGILLGGWLAFRKLAPSFAESM